MKGSYFDFESPQQQVDMHARSFSYKMHLFLSYLLNDSQTIHSTIHFSKPLLCVTLLCSDWSISFKAEHSVTLCTVLPWKQLQKWHLVAKNEFAFSFKPTSGRGNMLMFHDDFKQGLVLKTTRFNDSESTLSFERITLYTEHFQI